jgi:hypothetical protein
VYSSNHSLSSAEAAPANVAVVAAAPKESKKVKEESKGKEEAHTEKEEVKSNTAVAYKSNDAPITRPTCPFCSKSLAEAQSNCECGGFVMEYPKKKKKEKRKKEKKASVPKADKKKKQ